MDGFDIAGAGDRDDVVESLVSAFEADPVWSRAFPDPSTRPAALRFLWGTIVDQALPVGTTWMARPTGPAGPAGEPAATAAGPAIAAAAGSTCAAAAVWVPPGVREVSAEDAARVPGMLVATVGARSSILLEMFDRFDAAHPHDEPHYFLDLLGTHADHRGQGIGTRLLHHSLAAIDATGLPCYLESTNPANNDRYARAGFRLLGGFTVLEDDLPVTTMWRPGASR